MHGQIKLLIGPSCPEKSEALFEMAAARVRARREDSFLFIVPSPRRAEQIRERLLTETDHGMFRPFVGTFNDLIQTLYRIVGGREAPISDAVKAVLVQDIVSNHADSLGDLVRDDDREPFPGLVAKLVEFVSNLKRNLISPEEFRARTKSRRELAFVYEQYQSLLQKHGLVDGEGVFWLLREELRRKEAREKLGQFDLLLIDGIHDLTRAEEDVLIPLAEAIDETVIALDFWENGDQRCEAAHGFFERFSELPNCESSEFEPKWQPSSIKAHIDTQLFGRPSMLPERLPAKGRVDVVACIDPQDEVRFIAEQIKALAREADGDLDLTRVCVAFPRVHDYAQLVRELFPRHGIPFEISAGVPLAQAPVTASIMQLLQTVHDGYRRQDVVECLRSPYMSFVVGEDESPLDGNELDIVSRDAGVIEGSEHWTSTLAEHAARLRDEIDRYRSGRFDREREDDPEARLAKLESRLARAEAIRPGIERFIEFLKPLGDELEPEEFRARLHEILVRLEVQEQIARGYTLGLSADDVRRDARAFDRFLRCLDSVIFSAGFSSRSAYALVQYIDMLTSAIGQTLYQPQRHARGVLVTGVLDVRTLEIEHLFLGGLVEGVFPRIRQRDIFFSDAARGEIGIKLEPTVECEDRHVFYQCLSRVRGRVTLSYPTLVGGDERLRSPFVEEVLRLFEIDPRTPSRGDRPGTKSEFQTYVGRKLTGSGEQAVSVLRAWRAEDAPVAGSVLRNLQIRDERETPSTPSRFQGVFASESALTRIARRWPANRPFSITQLETYGKCPFSFFVSRVLRVEPLEDPTEDVTPLVRGDILHRIFRRYYTERREAGGAAITKDDSPEAECDRIKRIAEEELRDWAAEGLFWEAEREAIVGNAAIKRPGVLDMFIESEFKAAEKDACRPQYFEVAFGPIREADYVDPQLALAEVRIRSGKEIVARMAGKIDRIDVTTGNQFAVIDYKTGSTLPKRDALRHGVSLQLPVYVFAVKEGEKWAPLGGRYYQTHSADKFSMDGVLLRKSQKELTGASSGLSDEEFEEILQEARGSIIAYVQAIRRGRFPPMYHRQHPWCQEGCAFSDICRVDRTHMTDEDVRPLICVS